MKQLEKLPGGEYPQYEYIISKSKFIASAGLVFSESEAKDFVLMMKKRYYDATHNVSAFIIGDKNGQIMGSSDDREPSGTAGKPVLQVIAGSGVSNIVIVVTRYFGGIKLGTGGLVRAYSQGAKGLFDILPVCEMKLCHKVSVNIPYQYYDICLRLFDEHRVIESNFSDDVSIVLIIETEKYPLFEKSIVNITNGVVKIGILEKDILC